MKKHSWIVVLIIALSFTGLFISCGVDADEFYAVTGIKTGIEVGGDAKIDADGIVTMVKDSSLFEIVLPAKTAADGKTIKLEYVVKSSGSGTKVKLTKGDASWNDIPDTGSTGVNKYPVLTVGLISTLEVPAKAYPVNTEKLGFQSLDKGANFLLRIISIKME